MQPAPRRSPDQQVGRLMAAASPFAVGPAGFPGVAAASGTLDR